MNLLHPFAVGGNMRLIAIIGAACIAAAIAPAHARPQASSADDAPQVVYRCEAGSQITYTNIPHPGCVVVFTYAKAAPPSADRTVPTIGRGFYTNHQGEAVLRPVRTSSGQAPPGASAQCRDGSYSFSAHHRGTCSHHGGVARWL